METDANNADRNTAEEHDDEEIESFASEKPDDPVLRVRSRFKTGGSGFLGVAPKENLKNGANGL